MSLIQEGISIAGELTSSLVPREAGSKQASVAREVA